MRVDIGDSVSLLVDIDGPGFVPDGPVMRTRPTLLLLHGGPDLDFSLFHGSGLESLRDVAQVVYYDHRGAGRSDRDRVENWNLDTWADDVVRLCDSLGIDRPVVLGSSFGGMVAQRYLARHPHHPAKVVLAGTSARLDLGRMHAAFDRRGVPNAGDIAVAHWGSGERGQEYASVCLPLYATDPVDMQRFARVIGNPDLSRHFKREYNEMDLRPGLANVTCPVLIVDGDLDPVCPPEAADEIAAAIPDGRVTRVRLAGASHLEASTDRIAEHVRDFILRD